MMTVHAIYEDGVFKPTEPVALPNGCEVTFDPEPVKSAREESEPESFLRWLKNRTPEEIEAAREELRKISPPNRELLPGQTLADVWPVPIRGDETEEEVRLALERLS